MQPWAQALVGSAAGGVVLATIAVLMGVNRLEHLRGVRFSRAQKARVWLAVFGVFTAFGFFAMSLAQP